MVLGFSILISVATLPAIKLQGQWLINTITWALARYHPKKNCPFPLLYNPFTLPASHLILTHIGRVHLVKGDDGEYYRSPAVELAYGRPFSTIFVKHVLGPEAPFHVGARDLGHEHDDRVYWYKANFVDHGPA